LSELSDYVRRFQSLPYVLLSHQVNVALICRTRDVLNNIKTSVCHITIYPALAWLVLLIH
jgi:hypothetical protein